MTGDLYRRAARQFIYPCSTIGHYTTWCNVEQAGFPLLMDVQHRLYREEGSVIQANEGWPMILDAMSKCKAMIIYARKIKEWPNCRGLVEVGVALSNGIPIFISCPEVDRKSVV